MPSPFSAPPGADQARFAAFLIPDVGRSASMFSRPIMQRLPGQKRDQERVAAIMEQPPGLGPVPLPPVILRAKSRNGTGDALPSTVSERSGAPAIRGNRPDRFRPLRLAPGCRGGSAATGWLGRSCEGVSAEPKPARPRSGHLLLTITHAIGCSLSRSCIATGSPGS